MAKLTHEFSDLVRGVHPINAYPRNNQVLLACVCIVDGDDREFGKNRTLSFASSCNQFIVFSMDERKWRKLFDKQIGIL